MKKVMMGNHAVSYAVMRARVEVISAYPITPQTQIVEMLSEMCASGDLDAKYIKVESEHSAMASCIAAATVGARTFTATSSQGLALMHELLHWAAGARLPIVLGEVNRAMGPGWNIWTDQSDSLSQRDTGWIQLYCKSNQEVVDLTIQAFKIAEKVLLPVMIIYDAFFLSHTSEVVDVPEPEEVDAFLPRREAESVLDTANPQAFNGLLAPDYYMEMRYKTQQAMETVEEVMEEVAAEYAEQFGRYYGVLETYKTDDAETILVACSTVASTAQVVIDQMRAEGTKVGLLNLRTFRPFPNERFRKRVAGAKKIAVIDRNFSFGCGGILAQEIRASLSMLPAPPPVFDYIAGLGGRDITPHVIRDIVEQTLKQDRPEQERTWVGLKA